MDRNDDLARIQALESELKTERRNVQFETEKVNNLKTEFALLSSKYSNMESENENLIQKLADLSMKQQELEDSILDKDGSL
mmetsp:Transcript_37497/g.33581  ORF Transcript_37497/g.33581 Transcript_37497/m.33581 type:complete len:81 (+) Transcript_37497:301-543(+)